MDSISIKDKPIVEMSITALRKALRLGELHPLEIYEAYMDKISLLNPVINAYTHLSNKLETDDIRDLPLSNIPIGIKDIFDVKGYPTTAGSQFLHYNPSTNASAVSVLTQNGAMVLGKTNTHEFAMGTTTINPHFGTTTNPWDSKRIAGGSSGGSAAAVGANMALVGLGSDTAGSTRIPAAFCGVIGLKPTYDQISCQGMIPLSWSLDHVGLLTRTVEDMQHVYSVFGTKSSKSYSLTPKTLRVGIIWDSISHLLDQVTNRAMINFVEQMQTLNIKTASYEFPLWEETMTCGFVISRIEAAAYHHKWLEEIPNQYGEDVRILLKTAQGLSGVEYVQAQRMRSMVIQKYEQIFESVDFLITPTVSVIAPLITDPVDRRVLTQFTMPFDVAGIPVVSIPVWASGSNLPVGIQIATKWNHELSLLKFARSIEEQLKSQSQNFPI